MTPPWYVEPMLKDRDCADRPSATNHAAMLRMYLFTIHLFEDEWY